MLHYEKNGVKICCLPPAKETIADDHISKKYALFSSILACSVPTGPYMVPLVRLGVGKRQRPQLAQITRQQLC